jgi:acetyl-CoA carboxylase alpha subunit
MNDKDKHKEFEKQIAKLEKEIEQLKKTNQENNSL